MGGRERLFGGDQLEAEVQATSLSAQSSLGRKCPTMAWRQDKGHSGPAGLGAVEEWGTQTRRNLLSEVS